MIKHNRCANVAADVLGVVSPIKRWWQNVSFGKKLTAKITAWTLMAYFMVTGLIFVSSADSMKSSTIGIWNSTKSTLEAQFYNTSSIWPSASVARFIVAGLDELLVVAGLVALVCILTLVVVTPMYSSKFLKRWGIGLKVRSVIGFGSAGVLGDLFVSWLAAIVLGANRTSASGTVGSTIYNVAYNLDHNIKMPVVAASFGDRFLAALIEVTLVIVLGAICITMIYGISELVSHIKAGMRRLSVNAHDVLVQRRLTSRK